MKMSSLLPSESKGFVSKQTSMQKLMFDDYVIAFCKFELYLQFKGDLCLTSVLPRLKLHVNRKCKDKLVLS